MKSYTLTIAGYHIRFESVSEGFELVPSQRFLRNITAAVPAGIIIAVHQGACAIPPGATRVFHAPYVEETDGVRVQLRADFWSVWKHGSDLYIRTIFPRSGTDNIGVLRFSLTTCEWDLWIDGGGKEADPFEYPLDGLVLYYLTVMHGDILIHVRVDAASGSGGVVPVTDAVFEHEVLKADGALRRARVQLALCTAQVLRNGLRLLTIEAPERM